MPRNRENPARAINKLQAGDMFKLFNLVQAEFIDSNLDDLGFARYASEKLGVTVSHSSVATARQNLPTPIPSRRELDLAKAPVDPAAELQALKQRVFALEQHLAAIDSFLTQVKGDSYVQALIEKGFAPIGGK